MDLQLGGKTVLITGGSRGIGIACASVFAREGAQPILVSRNAESLATAAAAIRADHGVAVRTIAMDLSAPGAAEKLAGEAGDIDLLVNNAGAIPGGTLEQIDESRWRQSWELKVFGYINLTRIYLPLMQAKRAGVIANVIGMAGASPRMDYVCGGAANASLIAFTRAVGAASARDGVRVFGVNPSATRTDRIVSLTRERAAATLGDAGRWQELFQHLPFGRLMEPVEVANLVAFGCSPMAGYLSGTVIDLDGGQLYAPAAR
jgi:3-oxoacyl-[acyl-carrier protein] reductase